MGYQGRSNNRLDRIGRNGGCPPVSFSLAETRMKTKKAFIKDQDGHPIINSKALLWGNNAAWLCSQCGELLGSRTGDSDYRVECMNKDCRAMYEIERAQNKSGRLNLGVAVGVRRIS